MTFFHSQRDRIREWAYEHALTLCLLASLAVIGWATIVFIAAIHTLRIK